MDEDVVVVDRAELGIIAVPSEQVVTVVTEAPVVVTEEMRSTITVELTETQVVAEGQQGPAGPPGDGGGGEIFILDVAPTATGIVSNKSMSADGYELVLCDSDTTEVRIHFGCHGGVDKYKPSVVVNGVTASLSESATARWFTGHADVVLIRGQVNTVTAVSDAGGEDTAQVNVLPGGPSILSIVFGAYPGTQTELKDNDTISVTITTSVEATEVSILASGAAKAGTIPVVAGVASGTITIAGTSGAQVVTAKAKNSFGTYGDNFSSSALTLNQTSPTIGALSVTYPASQQAIDIGQNATVNGTVTNFDTISYTSDGVLSISNPSTYELNKSVGTAYSGYDGSGTNYTITAVRAVNNSTTVSSTLVRVASVAPAATISINGNPTRLTSSPAGVDYEIRITPNQLVSSAPTLVASIGTWQGSWTNSGAYWKRNLRIADSDARGAGSFSSLSITGPSGIVGSTITSGSGYTVGGFSSRTVTFPAFSRVAPLGVQVADRTKTTFQIGAAFYTRYDDNAQHSNGYYIADANGDYNPTGSYVGLSDSAFAGANTTGTLTAVVVETA